MPLKWWARAIVYAFMGWCIELIFTTIADSLLSGDARLIGKSYLWMLPIWGLGVLGLEHVSIFLNKFKIGIRWRIIIFMILCFSFEYVCGFVIKSMVNVVPWDYSQSTWNVDGFIRLDYAPFWALSGIFLEPFIDFVKRIEIRGVLNEKTF